MHLTKKQSGLICGGLIAATLFATPLLAGSTPVLSHADTTTSDTSSTSSESSSESTAKVIATVKIPLNGMGNLVLADSPTSYATVDANGNATTISFAGNITYMTDGGLIFLYDDGTSKTVYRVSNNLYLTYVPGVTLSLTGTTAANTTLTLKYLDQAGQSIQTDQSLDTGLPTSDDNLTTLENNLLALTPTVDGYTFSTATLSGTTITYHYTSNQAGSSSDSSTSSSEDSSTATSSSAESSSQTTGSSSATSSPSTTSSSSSNVSSATSSSAGTSGSTSVSTGAAADLAVKGQAIYATQKIGLYRSPNFTKAARQVWYSKQTRTKRPQFVVTGYARTKAGTLRYRVRDINHTAKTNGRTGYVTANSSYVTALYYQKRPTQVRVINSQGVSAYRKVNLAGKVRHYKVGTTLKVKAIRHYHLTTRLLLTNGTYVTANKTLVIQK